MAKACAGRRFFQRFLRFRRRRPSLSPTPCRHPTKEKPPLATMQKAERTENMTNRSELPKKGQQTLIAPIFYRERPFHGKTHSTNHTLPLIFFTRSGLCKYLFKAVSSVANASVRPFSATPFYIYSQKTRFSPFFSRQLAISIHYRRVEKKIAGLGFAEARPVVAEASLACAKPRPACTEAGLQRLYSRLPTSRHGHAHTEATHGKQKNSKTAKQNNRNQGTGNTLRAPPPRSRTLRQAPRKTKPKENYKFFNESLATIQYLITFAATNANITRLLLKNTTRTPVKKALILQEP